MTQSSEERIPDADTQASARIIPFDRQSELQRAVQRRAQERIEADAHPPKVPLLRKIITFAIALVPVGLTVAAFLVAVHAVRVITSIVTAPAASPPVEAQVPVEESAPIEQRDGVVILLPDRSVAPPTAEAPSEDDAP